MLEISGPWQVIATATQPQLDRFLAACADTATTQTSVLMQILALNAGSQLGRQYDFGSIASPEEFVRRVPLRDYEQMEHDIELQMRGAAQLGTEPVRFYEQTGGSTSGAKLIPYTDSAMRAMRQAIYPWLADLVHNRPGMARGCSYWSLSPAGRAPRATADGTPIGSGSDLGFVDAQVGAALRDVMAAPDGLTQVDDIDDWRYLTLWALLTRPDLSLISVWSPSFLTSLLAALPAASDRLQADFRAHRISVAVAPQTQQALLDCADIGAAERLSSALAGGRIDTALLWPALDTISCWAHGSAARQLDDLIALFPRVFVQPKGLLATEGVVSLPLCTTASPVLAIRSGFFEFIDDASQSRLAHQLEVGHAYRVVLTTFAGLYRYDLGDLVMVTGHYRNAPLLEFVGRGGVVSDICGEKLCDAFVALCLREVDGFSMLSPVGNGYCLYVDSARHADADLPALAARIDARLAANPQYDYARRLNQLGPLRAARIDRPADRLIAQRMATGQRLGDIKPAALCLDTRWHSHPVSG